MPTNNKENQNAVNRQEAWKSKEFKRMQREQRLLESERRNEQLREAAARFA